MTASSDVDPPSVPSPDEAFTALGNETRMGILKALADADDGPLSFSTLRERVGMRDSGQFNYHLAKLDGHFIRKTGEGYLLRRPGRRVIEAVLSGAITDDPVVEPTPIDFECRFCGAPIEVSYGQETVELYCTDCAGQYGRTAKNRESIIQRNHGHLGGQPLPPAGVQGRSVAEMLQAASLWGHLQFIAWGNDVCPQCSAVVEHTLRVCETHDVTETLCPQCDRRHAVQLTSRCTNCGAKMDGLFGNHLIKSPALRTFVAAHGIDPITNGVEWGWDYDEQIISIDPFEARFTFTLDGDAITLAVDDDLDVVVVTDTSLG